MKTEQCTACGHSCIIPEGGYGRCRMYTVRNNVLTERFPDQYLALWPGSIETIPFLHFTPGARYLLLSTIGCNLFCNGCVSHILAKSPDLVSGALRQVSPAEILREVREQSCNGALFCLNEPTVSKGTIIRVAGELRRNGFWVGCASNGCFGPDLLDDLLTHTDCINIGLKGSSDAIYEECGAPCGIEEIFETIRRIYQSDVHLEISIVYRRGKEDEVLVAAERISRISVDIPLHIMRFVPFEGAFEGFEPTPAEADRMVLQCRRYIKWVYLFNTPGTRWLSTFCPTCGELLIERSFYGPMGARLAGTVTESVCRCGQAVPVRGSFYRQENREPRYRGGYRTPVFLDMIASTLGLIGVTDEEKISRTLVRSLSGSYPEEFQKLLSTPEGYLDFLALLGNWSGTDPGDLIRYLGEGIQVVRNATRGKHPKVLCTMADPLLPSFPDKMEVSLVAHAGSEVCNYSMIYSEDTARPFTAEQFNLLDPEVIIVSGSGGPGVESYLERCREAGITAQAVRDGRVYRIPREYQTSGPFWLLTLKYIANILHPDLCTYDLTEEEQNLVSRIPGLSSSCQSSLRGSM